MSKCKVLCHKKQVARGGIWGVMAVKRAACRCFQKKKKAEKIIGEKPEKSCVFLGAVAGNPFSPGNLNSHAPKLPTCHILSLALPLSLLLLRWL